jgi:hypothetical protein
MDMVKVAINRFKADEWERYSGALNRRKRRMKAKKSMMRVCKDNTSTRNDTGLGRVRFYPFFPSHVILVPPKRTSRGHGIILVVFPFSIFVRFNFIVFGIYIVFYDSLGARRALLL